MSAVTETGAEGVRWDRTPLGSAEAMKEQLEAAVAAAGAFVGRWPAESIATIEPADLATLLRELAELRAIRWESDGWVFMLELSEGVTTEVRDLKAWIEGRFPRLEEAFRHFELAWVEIPDERAAELAGSVEVLHERHFLLALRRFRPFMLSSGEERVLAAREATASRAWQLLYERTLAGATARFEDGGGERDWSLQKLEVTSATHSDREVRGRAWAAKERALEPVLPLLAQCYDALVADRLAVDELRGHGDPMERRNLENELDPGVVEQLLTASKAHYELAHRWFRLKARLLGLDRLDTIDVSAPVFDVPVIRWDEGRRLALDVFANLAPTLADEATALLTDRRVDAEVRQTKVFGGIALHASTRTPGFLAVNWSGSLRDLLILTHELGHATHFAIAARAQSDNSFLPGLTIMEVPSTFAHLRLVDDLLGADSELGPAVLASALDNAVLYVFFRAALTRWEREAYVLRSRGEALTGARLNELCEAELAEVWGDAMTDTQGFRPTMWAPMTHFVYDRFYLYAYGFAFLLAAGLLARSRAAGFAERYERFLAAGGSASPDELMRILDVDLGDSGVWDDGYAVIDGWLDRLSG